MLLNTIGNPSSVTILIRLQVGAVFVSEGVQKFLYPAELGAGRFAKIGIPAPEILGPFVGVVELVAGALIVAGLLTRVAAIPLIMDMLVALATTKLPILLGSEIRPFQLRSLERYGFWSMAHEMRTDWAMLLGCVFLLFAGAGKFSIDSELARRGRPV